MSLVRVHKASTRADFPILSSLTPTTPVRRRSHTDNYLRDLGYCKRTRKRLLRAAQRGMLRVIIQTKKNTKSRRKPEEKTFVTTKSARRFEEEISTHNECDQDSRSSFDDDEENTTSHEDNLEDWIDFVKRSTKETDEKMLRQRRARASGVCSLTRLL